jgi:uracil-DNA glycosylase family 4
MEESNHWDTFEAQLISCRSCPRLVAWREEVALKRRRAYQDEPYWGKPVPGFGDHDGKILAVGLAPGAHGSNRTGRMFTGDSSGDFLYRALFQAGFANQDHAKHREDGLALTGVFISAVCRCAPPGNKPQPGEIKNCLPYLEQEIRWMNNLTLIVVLGRIAFDQVRVIYQGFGKHSINGQFKHGSVFSLGEGMPDLLASYHPSRQNTQTGRLTEPMFASIWERAREITNP